MGRLIRPKTWDGNCRNFGDFWDSRECLETVVGCGVRICVINSILVIRRPEMGMEIGSTKRNRRRKYGLPVDSPLPLFGTVKTIPSLCEMDKNHPCVLGI